jgi:hypothetical protein
MKIDKRPIKIGERFAHTNRIFLRAMPDGSISAVGEEFGTHILSVTASGEVMENGFKEYAVSFYVVEATNS